MKLPENITDDTSLFIDESKLVSSSSSSSSQQESLPSSEYLYTEIVKAIDNKRSSSCHSNEQHEYGLPPTGKRIDHDQNLSNKISNRIRMRSRPIRNNNNNSQSQQIPLVRPVSFSDRYDRLLIDKLSNQSTTHNGSLSMKQSEQSPTSLQYSVDTLLQYTTPTSPSFDNSDFISDTSTASSVTTTTTNTILCVPSNTHPRRKSSSCDRIYSSTTRPLLSEYQQIDLNHIDYKFLSPVLNTNTIPQSSPISSLPSSTSSSSSSSSSSTTLFTCSKGHEESSPSPKGSFLNQYASFTSQTSTIDASPDEDNSHPTTTRSIMTMSILPNHHHHNQTHSISPITNNTDGLKQQQHNQIESTIVSGGCLKTQKNNKNRIKKSVHFDWNMPKDVRSTSPSTHCNYRQPVTVTSSSLSTSNISNTDNEEQKKKNDSETMKEKEKIETTRRTIITPTTPLTTHIIHRSFSLSPSPLSRRENNDSRRHRQEKKENVDELNSTTTTTAPIEQVTTAATHLHCTTNASTVNLNISSTKKLNDENLSYEIMSPVKTSPLDSQTTSTTTKKFIGSGGFFSFINRSNNKSSLSIDENKQLRRTSSTQRKSRQHGHKRLSADVEALINKVTINPSTTDNNANTHSSNRSSISMLTNSLPNEEDSLNNGLLFQPNPTIKKEPFFLTPSKSLSINDNSSMMMQTSTLIISTQPQYHYYLYPPTITKKNSNISMNSISTNSTSSSSSSCESQIQDLDDETLSYASYTLTNPKNTKPVILSDSVQAFWPPPPPSSSSSSQLNNDPEQIIVASTVEQNKHSNLINNYKYKQSEMNTIQNNLISSNCNDDSLAMKNGNQTDVLPPTTSLMLNNNEEVRTYSERNSFDNSCMQIANNTTVEDTQASYTERLREKSRSITSTTNRPLMMNFTNYSLTRSNSKDALDTQTQNSINTNYFRPKSAGQVRTHVVFSPVHHETSNDFQSKRQFFENRTYTDYPPPPPPVANNRIYTLSPSNTPINYNQQRHVTKCSWNDLSSRQPPPPLPPSPESMIRTTKYFDSSSNQPSSPPSVYRKPIRIVKAVQRSNPSPSTNELKTSFSTKINSENDLKTYSLSSSNELIINPKHHYSSEYIRNLFPIPDRRRRNRSRQNSGNDNRTVSNDNIRQTDDLLLNFKKRLEILKDKQQIINNEIQTNAILGIKLINIIESQAELNEIAKLKLHISEIDTITSVLLKLSSRLAKVENDLLMITDNKSPTKINLLEQREKIQQKHDEAKTLKDGIDRRSRLVTNILRKYYSDEEYEDYDHFIRMKSTLLMDAKDIEENISLTQKQIQLLSSSSPMFDNLQRSNSLSTNLDCFQPNYYKSISTTA